VTIMTGTEGKVVIRAMEPEDITGVLEVDRKITGVQRSITYTDLITGDLGGELDLSFVAEVSGRVSGFLLARRAYVGEPVAEVGLIQILGVDPDYWRQGIASKLVSALSDTCQSRKLGAVRVMVKEHDSQLKAFFSHMGFHRGALIDYTRTV